MKPDIHPPYYPDAMVRCACGNEWKTGATVPELKLGICSNCHPFFTGNEKIVDSRGRIEKFDRRRKLHLEHKGSKTAKRLRQKKVK